MTATAPMPMHRVDAVTYGGRAFADGHLDVARIAGIALRSERGEMRKLFAQAKLFDQRAIAVGIAGLQVVEQLATPRYHPQ